MMADSDIEIRHCTRNDPGEPPEGLDSLPFGHASQKIGNQPVVLVTSLHTVDRSFGQQSFIPLTG